MAKLSIDEDWLESMRVGLEGACLTERRRFRADSIYLLVMGTRVLAMQSGFAMMEAAFVRPINAANIMMKNMMDVCVGCIGFFLVGYQLAFGVGIATWEESGQDWAMWFLQFSYVSASATIVSGAVAGRVKYIPYVLLSFTMTSVICPVVVRWTWGGGWLQAWGYDDFGGATVVHLVGAASSFVSICVAGPRIGRFKSYRGWRKPWSMLFAERNTDAFYQGPLSELEARIFQQVNPITNPTQATFGVFLLFIGFLAFNPGAVQETTDGKDLLVVQTTITTLFATVGAGLCSFPLAVVHRRSLNITVPELLTNAVAGMVASAGCCHVVPPLLAPLVGAVAALLADRTAMLLSRVQLDDTVGAVSAHGPPGAWGVLAAALLAKPNCQGSAQGLVFGFGSASWKWFGVSVAGILAILAFVLVSTYASVLVLDLLLGFRSERATELIGHDFVEHAFEDGSIRVDPNKNMVMTRSVSRDCVAERIRRRASSKESAGHFQNTYSDPYTPKSEEDFGELLSEQDVPRVEALDDELRRLRRVVVSLRASASAEERERQRRFGA